MAAAALLAAASAPAAGEEAAGRPGEEPPRPADAEGREEEEEGEGGVSVTVVPGLGYGPETSLLVAGRGVVVLDDGAARPSLVNALVAWTLERQVIVRVTPDLWLDDGRYRARLSTAYFWWPNLFFGTGNGTSIDDGESYVAQWGAADLWLERLVAPQLYVGLMLSGRYITLVETEPGGLLDRRTVPGTEGGPLVSVGASATWDTRDRTTYTRSGGVVRLQARAFPSFLGSAWEFARGSLTATRVVSPHEDHVFALRALGIAGFGELPFHEMPGFGGPYLVRGYFDGRYRDHVLLAADLEYRWRVWWRLGLVVFGGAGQVGRRLDDLSATGFHPAGGAGLRVLLDRSNEVNGRLDFAWGKDQRGMYIQVGEAF